MIRDIFSGLLSPKKAGATPTPDPSRGLTDGALPLRGVFSTSVIAPASYIDRSTQSTHASTRDRIRRLNTALQQDGLVVGVYGEAKSGKTMFTRKALMDAGYGFVIAEGSEIKTLDGFWRHIAEKLQLNIRRHISTVNEKHAQDHAEVSGSASTSFYVPAVKVKAGLKTSSETRTLEGMTVHSEVLESVREACLNFLEAANMAVIVDDFHAVKDAVLRKEILLNVKVPAGLNRGKYVFVAIPEEALFVGQSDEQLIARNGVHEFPTWSRTDLQEIARQGFRALGIGYEESHITYIERNCFANPINVQQICINICSVCGIKTSADVPAGFVIPRDKVRTALADFANELRFFDDIIRQAESKGGVTAAERKYNVNGVSLNVYQLVFATLCSAAATSESGVRVKTIRDRIRRFLNDDEWKMPKLAEILKRLADSEINLQFARRGPDPNASKRPLYFDGEKLYVTNPMLRVYLLWGYLQGLGLDQDRIVDAPREGA